MEINGRKGRFRRVVTAGALLATSSAIVASGTSAFATASGASSKAAKGSPVVFHVISPISGTYAALGATESNMLHAIAKRVNDKGGIHGHPIKMTIKNDNGTPKTAVSFASKWVSEKVPFIINGGAGATAEAVAALITPSGPFVYDLSPAITPKPTPTDYVFVSGSTVTAQWDATLKFMKAKGLTKVAYINDTTTSGASNWKKAQQALKTPQFSQFTLTTHQTFAPTAPTVTTQMAAIKASNPQWIWAPVNGSAFGTVLQAEKALGLSTVPTVSDAGDATFTLLKKLSSVLPKTLYFQGGPLDLPPSSLTGSLKAVVATYDDAVITAGSHVGEGSALPFDPAHLFVDALKKLGVHATAKQIRHYMEHLHKVPGIWGLYTTSPTTHRGLSQNDVYMLTFNGTSFQKASGPGGALLTGKKK